MRWSVEVLFQLHKEEVDWSELYIDIIVWLRQLNRFSFKTHNGIERGLPSIFAGEAESNSSVIVSTSHGSITVKIDNDEALVEEFKAKFG